jgi:hypothetical protein
MISKQKHKKHNTNAPPLEPKLTGSPSSSTVSNTINTLEHPLLRASRLGDVELLQQEINKLKEFHKLNDVNMTDTFGR